MQIKQDKKTKEEVDVADEILDIYILNQLATLATFVVLAFGLWLELRKLPLNVERAGVERDVHDYGEDCLRRKRAFSPRLMASTRCTDAARNLQCGSKMASGKVPFSRQFFNPFVALLHPITDSRLCQVSLRPG